MKIKLSVITLSMVVLCSCEFNKSISQDLKTGLLTQGDGLSYETVSISDGVQELSRSSFVYGEKFYVNFEDIKGFNKSGGNEFPGMQLCITSQAGDTIMANDDLYANYEDGINISPLLLQANITAANPIRSNNNYTFHINIWDKKGKGTLKAKMDFDVVPNHQIKIGSNNVSYDEIYLFSQERMVVVIDNHIKLNENIYMMLEGLEGFTQEDGRVYFGLSIMAKDAEGKIILNEKDLVGESSMELSELKKQIAPRFVFTDSGIKNPVSCNIKVWDKRSESKIQASVKLNVE